MTDVCSTFELAVPARLSGTSSVVDEGRCRLAKRSSADAVLIIEISRRCAGFRMEMGRPWGVDSVTSYRAIP